MNDKWRSWLSYMIPAGVILLVAWYLIQNWGKYSNLLRLSPLIVSQLLLLSALYLVLNGILATMLYRLLGVTIGYHEGIGLSFVGSLANLLPFAGGIASRAVYLRRRFGLTYGRFVGATVVLYICFISADGWLGLLSLSYLVIGNTQPFESLWLVFLLFAVMSLAIALPLLPLQRVLPTRWRRSGEQILAGWQVLHQRSKSTLLLVGLQLVGVLIFAGRYWLAFHALSQDLQFTQALLFAAATTLTQLVSISPGGIGIREGIVAALATVLGFDSGTSLIAVSLERIVSTSVIIISGTAYSFLVARNLLQGEVDSVRQDSESHS